MVEQNKNKMKQQKNNHSIIFRLTQEEKEKLKANAKKCGLSVSKFIRKQSIETSPNFLSQEDRNELQELKKIAIEINRTLNLYHEKRLEHSPFFKRVRKFVSKINK